MTLTVSPTLDDVMTKLRAFVLGIVPAGTIVLRGPVDRATYPATDFVLLTPLWRNRLRTNVYRDVDPFPLPDPGTTDMEQGTQLEVQVDCYGDTFGADWCAMFTTVFRSDYGVQALAPTCAPLYADEGRMVPLVTGEEQYLERWLVRAMLQYNPVTTTPQQFADAVDVTLINVDVEYPPS